MAYEVPETEDDEELDTVGRMRRTVRSTTNAATVAVTPMFADREWNPDTLLASLQALPW